MRADDAPSRLPPSGGGQCGGPSVATPAASVKPLLVPKVAHRSGAYCRVLSACPRRCVLAAAGGAATAEVARPYPERGCDGGTRASNHQDRPLPERSSNLPVLVLSERPERLRPNETHRGVAERELGNSGVVGSFRDRHGVILTGHQIERRQLGARLAEPLLRGV